MKAKIDRRVQRTRHALVEAFSRLVLERRREIRVTDVVEAANVGRSTFYDHYSSTDALQLEALRRPLTPIADAAAGSGSAAALTKTLQHLWDYRQRARSWLAERTERLLSEMIEERLSDARLRLPVRLAARQLAGAVLGPIVAWLRGEAPCRPEQLADSIIATAVAIRAALR